MTEGTRIKVKNFMLDDYLKKTVLVNLDGMEDCSHPHRVVSKDHVARVLHSFQSNGLDTRMGWIYVRLNHLNNKGHGPETEIFNRGKPLPVLKTNLTVEVVDGHHRLTVMRQLQTSTDAASFRVSAAYHSLFRWTSLPGGTGTLFWTGRCYR